MANKKMSVTSWLNNDDGGGKAKYLKIDFKDKSFYKLWIYPNSEVGEVWRSVLKFSDGEKIRLTRWNAGAFEDDKVLEKTLYLEEDGSFEHPPLVDPVLLLIQWVNQQIVSGKIGFTDEILKWEASDSDTEVTHAGGFTGMFQSRKLDEKQRGAMRKIGVRQDEAYLYNAKPQKETVFTMVDNSNPADGPQVVTLRQGPARAILKAIQDRQLLFTKDPEKADISKYPACILLKKEASQKGAPPHFSAAFTDDDLTDEIQAAFDMPEPDTSNMYKPTNALALRENLESAWVHELVPDWDEIFAPFMEIAKGTSAVEDPASFDYGKNKKNEAEEDEDEEKTSSVSNTLTPKSATEDEEETEESLVCDKCGGKLDEEEFEKDMKCPHCGAEYEKKGEGEYELKPEKKKEIKASRRPRT